MIFIKDVILKKKVLAVLVQVILLQNLAYAMQIAERTYKEVSVNSQFLKACKARDSEQIISLLEKGADVNANDKEGRTALYYAAQMGHQEIVDLLIVRGVKVNARDVFGVAALRDAAFGGKKEIAELLISKGADVHAKAHDGLTALYAAAERGHKEIAELLISKGANVNEKAISGMTVLHFATYQGHKEIAELLIKNGAEVNAKDNNGWTSLYYSSNSGWTALHYAAKYNRKEIAALLILNGADVHAKDKDGLAALHYAADKGNKEIAELLIKNRADINAKTKEGVTALHIAALKGHKEIAALLILNGADVNVKDNDGETALHIGLQRGYEEIIKLLIEKGADVNAQDKFGVTALHYAAQKGHKEIAALLISKEAKVDAKNFLGKTALHGAAWMGYKETAELLISKRADVNVKDNDGETALYCAVKSGHKEHKEIIELLILKGAEVSVKNKSGRTPLYYASTDDSKNVMYRALIFRSLLSLLQANKRLMLLFDQKSWLVCEHPSAELNKLVSELNALALQRKIAVSKEIQSKKEQAEKTSNISLPLFDSQLLSLEDSAPRFCEKYRRKFNVGLALDGEGLEVLMTVSMVKKLEEELECSVHELFDCVVGSSLGGILALGLVASKESNCRLLKTDDLRKFFEKFQRKNKPHLAYDDLKQQVNALFKSVRLSDSLTRVIVPCKKQERAYDFDSGEALKRQEANCPIVAIARALIVDPSEVHLSAADLHLLDRVTASSEYKNKSAGLLLKKMKSSLDESQRGKLHILYCASNPLGEGPNRVHDELYEELNASAVRYCRIKPENNDIGSFDSKELLAVYKEKGEAAAELFLKGNESFIRILRENRADKHSASY